MQEQFDELPYSNIIITLEDKKRIRGEMVVGGVLLLLLGLTLRPNFFEDPALLLFILPGLTLIAVGFLSGKDSWYQIDGPAMTESERRIWQIPADAQNADKFYAVVSEKVGRMS